MSLPFSLLNLDLYHIENCNGNTFIRFRCKKYCYLWVDLVIIPLLWYAHMCRIKNKKYFDIFLFCGTLPAETKSIRYTHTKASHKNTDGSVHMLLSNICNENTTCEIYSRWIQLRICKTYIFFCLNADFSHSSIQFFIHCLRPDQCK